MMIFLRDRLVDKLSDTTLLALRVLLASTVGMLICYTIFSITGESDFRDRIYWVIFAVVSVSASTNSNIVYTRAKEIALFSVLGCATGSLLLFILQEYLDFQIFVALACSMALVLYIYTMYLNYATSIFFIHVYLVMFFGLFVHWDGDMFIVRVTCVLIGTVSILTTMLLTRSSKNKKEFLKLMYTIYADFRVIVNSMDRKVSNKKLIALIENNISLNDALLGAKYEFDTRREYYSYKQVIILMDELLINLKTYRVLLLQQKHHRDDLYSEFIVYTNEAIKKNFEKLTIRYDRILLQNQKS